MVAQDALKSNEAGRGLCQEILGVLGPQKELAPFLLLLATIRVEVLAQLLVEALYLTVVLGIVAVSIREGKPISGMLSRICPLPLKQP